MLTFFALLFKKINSLKFGNYLNSTTYKTMTKIKNVKLRYYFILISLGFVWLSFSPPGSGRLNISIENINAPKGVIWVGIYNSPDNFLIKERSILKKIKVNHTGSAHITIPSLPYGEYAIALFHDINENGTLDNNYFGVPSEPYAFSGRIKSKWRLPYYKEVKFFFWQKNNNLKLKLKKWWE